MIKLICKADFPVYDTRKHKTIVIPKGSHFVMRKQKFKSDSATLKNNLFDEVIVKATNLDKYFCAI